MLLDLQIEILSEDLLMPCDGIFSSFHVAGYDVSWNLSRNTCRAADKSSGIFLHDLMGYPRLVIVLSFDVTGRYYLHQILVALIVLGEQDQVVISLVVLVLELVVVVSGDIDLASYDWLDLRIFLRNLQKFLHAVHVSMVGDGQCRHAELFRSFKKTAYRGLTVKDGILCVDVKMDEGHIFEF